MQQQRFFFLSNKKCTVLLILYVNYNTKLGEIIILFHLLFEKNLHILTIPQ